MFTASIRVGLLLLVGCAVLPRVQADELPNPGFEQGLSEWSALDDRDMSSASAEAAHTGTHGLRVADESEKAGSSLKSLPLATEPEKKYELSFWARGVSGLGGVGVYLRFLKENDKEAKKAKFVAVSSDSKEWKRYTVVDTAPELANGMQVWVHSFTKDTAVIDFDDFELKEVP